MCAVISYPSSHLHGNEKLNYVSLNMTTHAATTFTRTEIAAWSLTGPAVIGFVSWIVSWIAYFASIYHTIGFTRDTTAIQVVFVLMIWIGPATSLAGMILTRSRLQSIRHSVLLYVINGVWMIVSLSAFALWLRDR